MLSDSDFHNESNSGSEHSLEKFGNILGGLSHEMTDRALLWADLCGVPLSGLCSVILHISLA